MRADKIGEGLGLSEEEIAFYDALADNNNNVFQITTPCQELDDGKILIQIILN